ncbi:MAG: hypothetical protein CVT88_05430 [Candidatus Altiarchaeales archaeon HGW-Altiarchaeales-1]|nr:MAG: hypothetical protein CVT88_05430 [Candidatus Altiarchaeales archaeon HGW-Altiarchaeales-1]
MKQSKNFNGKGCLDIENKVSDSRKEYINEIANYTVDIGTENKVSDSRNRKKVVHIGILLEDNKKDKDWMRKTLSSDSSLDYMIEPRSVDDVFKYIRHLKRQGKRIGKMVLMGHGNKINPHIGRMQPADVDIYAMARQRKRYKTNYEDTKKNIKVLRAQLKSAEDTKTKEKLQKMLGEEREFLVFSRDKYDESVKELNLFKELSGAMDSNAVIGLLNCSAAGSAKGKEMMRNLGKIFLRERGGRVVGCTGNIWTIHAYPVMAWLTDTDDITVKPWGEWVNYNVRPSKVSHCNGYNHDIDCQCGWGIQRQKK